jgi:hypothetical protein
MSKNEIINHEIFMASYQLTTHYSLLSGKK